MHRQLHRHRNLPAQDWGHSGSYRTDHQNHLNQCQLDRYWVRTDRLDQVLYDSPSDWDVVDAVKKVARERDVKPAQVALAWVLSRPGVAAPIIGATRLEHLDDAIGAVGLTLSEAEIGTVEAPYRPHPVKGLAPARLQITEALRHTG